MRRGVVDMVVVGLVVNAWLGRLADFWLSFLVRFAWGLRFRYFLFALPVASGGQREPLKRGQADQHRNVRL